MRHDYQPGQEPGARIALILTGIFVAAVIVVTIVVGSIR